MTARNLVLDTNSLDVRGFVHWLQAFRGRKILPVVAFVELGVHYRARDQFDRFEALLERTGIEVEWMRREDARQAIEDGVRSGGFADRARDYLIGAHAAAPDRTLVTVNVRDFAYLERVTTPGQLMHG